MQKVITVTIPSVRIITNDEECKIMADALRELAEQLTDDFDNPLRATLDEMTRLISEYEAKRYGKYL